jgi:hypothetical protein
MATSRCLLQLSHTLRFALRAGEDGPEREKERARRGGEFWYVRAKRNEAAAGHTLGTTELENEGGGGKEGVREEEIYL